MASFASPAEQRLPSQASQPAAIISQGVFVHYVISCRTFPARYRAMTWETVLINACSGAWRDIFLKKSSLRKGRRQLVADAITLQAPALQIQQF